MYTSIAALALAATAVVAKEYSVELAGVAGTLAISDDQLAAGVDVENLVSAGAELKFVDLPITLPTSVIPARHRRARRAAAADQTLGSINGIFTDLSGELSPVLSTLSGLVSTVSLPAEQLASEVESHLSSVTGLLSGGLTKLQGLTGAVDSVTSEVTSVTKEAAANTVSGVYSDIANTLSAIKSAEADIPVLGGPLSAATTEIQSTLASITGELGTLSAPLTSTLSGLLAPLEGVLSDVGLGSLTGLLSGVLRQ